MGARSCAKKKGLDQFAGRDLGIDSQVGLATFWMYWVPGRPLSISLNIMLGYSPEKASIMGFFTIYVHTIESQPKGW